MSQRATAALAGLLVALALVVAAPAPAGAAELPAPSGTYDWHAVCNVSYQLVVPTSNSSQRHVNVRYACNVASTAYGYPLSTEHRFLGKLVYKFVQSNGTNVTGASALTTTSCGTTTPARLPAAWRYDVGGAQRVEGEGCMAIFMPSTATFHGFLDEVPGQPQSNWLTDGNQMQFCEPSGSGCRLTRGRLSLQAATTDPPTYPVDYFPGGVGGVPKVVVQPPAVSCEREFSWAGSTQYVRVKATVLNPQDHATDVVTTRLPWQVSDGGAESEDTPLPDLATMPESGWRAVCRVVRTLDLDWAVGSNPYTSVGSGEWQAQGMLERTDTADAAAYPLTDYTPAFSTTPADAGPWLTYLAGGGASGAAAAGAVGASVGAMGFVAGAALLAAGLLYVGDKTGAVSLDPDGCTLYDRLRAFTTAWSCPEPQDLETPADVYLRSQIQLRVVAGNALDRLTLQQKAQLQANPDWVTAEAVAEVLLDPRRPYAGTQTVTAIEAPTLTATEKAEVTGEAVPDPDNDACKLSLLSALNPFALFRTVRCVFEWAFIPSDATMASLANLWGDIQTKAPFSWAYETLTFIPNWMSGLAEKLELYSGECHYLMTDTGNTFLVPGSAQPIDAQPINCGEDSLVSQLGARGVFVRQMTTALYLIALAFGLYRLVVWAIS